jgi:hypothetical protein
MIQAPEGKGVKEIVVVRGRNTDTRYSGVF